jgi:hypothetical protein
MFVQLLQIELRSLDGVGNRVRPASGLANAYKPKFSVANFGRQDNGKLCALPVMQVATHPFPQGDPFPRFFPVNDP